jgi:hypothetical protein
MTDDVKGADDDLVAEMLRNYEATRAELTARGVALPDAAVDEEEAPLYRCNDRCWLGGVGITSRIYEPGDELEYWQVPNRSMVPLNASAKRRMREYLDHLTSCAAEVATRNGRKAEGGLLGTVEDWLSVSRADAQRQANATAAQGALEMPVDTTGRPAVPPQTHLSAQDPAAETPVFRAGLPGEQKRGRGRPPKLRTPADQAA